MRDGKCQGLTLEDGTTLPAQCVVITAGTFLKGKCYVGREEVVSAGRQLRKEDGYEQASVGLAESLRRLNFPKTRLKTGTPPRLRASSIDFSRLEAQEGDAEI